MSWAARATLSTTKGRPLVISPARAIDVFRVVEDLAKRGVKSPLLLRFPQLLEGQVNELAQSFANAIREYNYRERYHPVFPIKVNQQRAVVEGLVRSGWSAGLGLEAGSRPELLAAIALDLSPDALVVCNGFKDQAYLRMAQELVDLAHEGGRGAGTAPALYTFH